MIKKFKILIVFFLLLSFNKVYAKENVYYVNEETNYEVVYEDEANLLTENQKEELIYVMRPLTEYGNIAFKTIERNPSGSTDTFAERYYHSTFGKSSGTVFIIDIDRKNIYIFSDGANYITVNSSKAYIITDNVYKYASNKDYYSCALNAFDQIGTLLKGGKILEPMRHISNMILSIVVSSFITYYIAIESSKIRKPSTESIANESSVSFKSSLVDTKKIGEHRVYSPVDSGSSSSSGGGGGGGGGSSGGGGGHSF